MKCFIVMFKLCYDEARFVEIVKIASHRGQSNEIKMGTKEIFVAFVKIDRLIYGH